MKSLANPLGPRPILCAVLDLTALGDDPERRARAIFEAGADWIQLRERNEPDEPLLRVAIALVAARDALAARASTRRVLVNRRVDLALASAADGVHLGFDAISPSDTRRLLPPTALVGQSLHSVDEVKSASERGRLDRLDYVHLAPIWNPHSKRASRPPHGVGALAEACQTGLPVIAQGGVDVARAREAIAAGAAGVAVTGALARGAEPREILSPLRTALANDC